MMRTTNEVVVDALRQEISMLMEQCTEKERAFGDKIFAWRESQDQEKLTIFLELCQRTVRKVEKADA